MATEEVIWPSLDPSELKMGTTDCKSWEYDRVKAYSFSCNSDWLVHYGFEEPMALAVDNSERQALLEMEKLLGFMGILQQKVVDRQEELLAGKWARQQLHRVMHIMAWELLVVDTLKVVVVSFGNISLDQRI